VHPRVDEQRAVWERLDGRLRLHIVFVLNLADNLLHEVFQSHQPRSAAVLILQDCHMGALAAHLLQEFNHALAFGHKKGGAHYLAQAEFGGAVAVAQQVFRMHDADDVV
jgi:hypothetical protein